MATSEQHDKVPDTEAHDQANDKEVDMDLETLMDEMSQDDEAYRAKVVTSTEVPLSAASPAPGTMSPLVGSLANLDIDQPTQNILEKVAEEIQEWSDMELLPEMPLTPEKARSDPVQNVQPNQVVDVKDPDDVEVDTIMTCKSSASERSAMSSPEVVNTPDSDIGQVGTAVRSLMEQFARDPVLWQNIVRGVTALKRPRDDDDVTSDAKRSCTPSTGRSSRASPRDPRTPSPRIPTPTGDFKIPAFGTTKAKQPVGLQASGGSSYDQGKHHDLMMKKNFQQPPSQALARNAPDQGPVVTRVQPMGATKKSPVVGTVAAVCYNCRAPGHRYSECTKAPVSGGFCRRCGRRGQTLATCPKCSARWLAAGPYVPAYGCNVPRGVRLPTAPPSEEDLDFAQSGRFPHQDEAAALSPPRRGRRPRGSRRKP